MVFFQNSFVVRMCVWLLNVCSFLYNGSALKKCLSYIGEVIRGSGTFRIFSRYANKKPCFRNSLSYKLVTGIWRFFDKTADAIHDFFENLSKGSIFKKIASPILSNYEKTVYFLAAYVFIDYFLRTYIPGFASIWDELFFILLIGVWVIKYIAYRNEPNIKITPLDLPVIIFMTAVTFILIIHSPDIIISIEGYRAIIQYILWYFIVLQILRTEKDAKNICLALVIAASVIAVHGIYQYIAGVEMPAGWVDSKEAGVRTRIFSIIGSPNILGSLMTLTLPICVSFVFTADKLKKKLMYASLSLIIALALVFSFSRGAWLGFAGAVMVYVFMKDKRLIIPVVIAGVLAAALVPSIGDRIVYMLSPEYIESSLRGGRLIRWINGLEILKQNPVIGVGLGHFGGAVAMNNGIIRLIGIDMYKTFYMDNYYLKTAVESGLIGLCTFVILMYQVFICSYRTIKTTRANCFKELEIGILAGLVGVVFHNLVENIFEVPMMAVYFWMLAAVMMHLWFINNKEVG